MSRTLEQLRGDFNRLFPDRDWNQSCQAVVAHAAEFTVGNVRFYLTAKDAYHASKIISKNPSKAARNDVHFWAIGTAWHTGVDVGGGYVLMGTKHTDGSWGKNLGLTTVAAYTAATGAVYMGFAHTDGVNRVAIAAPKPAAKGSARVRLIAAYLNDWARDEHLDLRTSAAEDGIVDQTGQVKQVYWLLEQKWGRAHNHYGTAFRVDGKVARVGGQTRKVDAILYELAKTAAAKK